MANLQHKRGDTFAYSATVTGIASLSGWGIASQIRDGNNTLLHNLQVTATAATSFDLTVTGATTGWPVGGILRWDIKYTASGSAAVSRTETALIEVVQEVTA